MDQGKLGLSIEQLHEVLAILRINHQQYFSRNEAAIYLRMSLRQFQKFQDEIPQIKVDTFPKFERKDLDSFMGKHKIDLN